MSFASKRVMALPHYAVGAIAARKRELLAEGRDVIDLGAGDADFAPPSLAVDALARAAADPAKSRYAFQLGSVTFRESVVRFMERRFHIAFDPITEVLPVIGSKEALAHLPFAVTDPGDVCIVPEPGYPAYLGGVSLAGAEPYIVPLEEKNGFLLELDHVPANVLSRAKLLFLNYPNNPTGAVATQDYLQRTVDICREHNILLAYDNPYSELTFDDYVAPSIFEIPGAKDIAIEFHSLSKSFAMTGWRLGFAVGNPQAVELLSKVKGYVDTGQFLAIQEAGALVLDRAEELVTPVRSAFLARRDALVTAGVQHGWNLQAPKGGLYFWVGLPPGVASGEVAQDALEQQGVAILAGSVFGQSGEGFVRLSLTVGPDRLQEAAGRLNPIFAHYGVVSV